MTIVHYDPEQTMRQARELYFAANHFGTDGGYGDAWVDLKLGPVPLPFPNSASRVRALRFHDLHHILTGYDTTLIGELEIAGWEIGAGCRNQPFAWFINLSGLGAFWLSPRRIFRAFVRGLRSQSLYGQDADALLTMKVHQVRTKMAVPTSDEPPPSLGEIGRFVVAATVGFAVGLFALVLIVPLAPIGVVALNLRRRASANTVSAT